MSSKDLLDNIKKLRELTGVGFKDCKNALDDAIVTGIEDRNSSSVARCKHVAGRVLSK